MVAKHIAIVPARSGSKGVKNKNVRLLGGVPLLGRTVQAAREANIFDAVYCSTDSEDYAVIAKKYGALVPMLRSNTLATDESPVLDALKELIIYLQSCGEQIATITLLQVTSPFRTANHIFEAYQLFANSEAESLVSVCAAKTHPLWLRTIVNNQVETFIPRDGDYYQRQQLPPVYQVNGAIYITRPHYIIEQNRLLGDVVIPYVMPEDCSIDIDSEYDWAITEWQFNHGYASKNSGASYGA